MGFKFGIFIDEPTVANWVLTCASKAYFWLRCTCFEHAVVSFFWEWSIRKLLFGWLESVASLQTSVLIRNFHRGRLNPHVCVSDESPAGSSLYVWTFIIAVAVCRNLNFTRYITNLTKQKYGFLVTCEFAWCVVEMVRDSFITAVTPESCRTTLNYE